MSEQHLVNDESMMEDPNIEIKYEEEEQQYQDYQAEADNSQNSSNLNSSRDSSSDQAERDKQQNQKEDDQNGNSQPCLNEHLPQSIENTQEKQTQELIKEMPVESNNDNNNNNNNNQSSQESEKLLEIQSTQVTSPTQLPKEEQIPSEKLSILNQNSSEESESQSSSEFIQPTKPASKRKSKQKAASKRQRSTKYKDPIAEVAAQVISSITHDNPASSSKRGKAAEQKARSRTKTRGNPRQSATSSSKKQREYSEDEENDKPTINKSKSKSKMKVSEEDPDNQLMKDAIEFVNHANQLTQKNTAKPPAQNTKKQNAGFKRRITEINPEFAEKIEKKIQSIKQESNHSLVPQSILPIEQYSQCNSLIPQQQQQQVLGPIKIPLPVIQTLPSQQQQQQLQQQQQQQQLQQQQQQQQQMIQQHLYAQSFLYQNQAAIQQFLMQCQQQQQQQQQLNNSNSQNPNQLGLFMNPNQLQQLAAQLQQQLQQQQQQQQQEQQQLLNTSFMIQSQQQQGQMKSEVQNVVLNENENEVESEQLDSQQSAQIEVKVEEVRTEEVPPSEVQTAGVAVTKPTPVVPVTLTTTQTPNIPVPINLKEKQSKRGTKKKNEKQVKEYNLFGSKVDESFVVDKSVDNLTLTAKQNKINSSSNATNKKYNTRKCAKNYAESSLDEIDDVEEIEQNPIKQEKSADQLLVEVPSILLSHQAKLEQTLSLNNQVISTTDVPVPVADVLPQPQNKVVPPVAIANQVVPMEIEEPNEPIRSKDHALNKEKLDGIMKRYNERLAKAAAVAKEELNQSLISVDTSQINFECTNNPPQQQQQQECSVSIQPSNHIKSEASIALQSTQIIPSQSLPIPPAHNQSIQPQHQVNNLLIPSVAPAILVSSTIPPPPLPIVQTLPIQGQPTKAEQYNSTEDNQPQRQLLRGAPQSTHIELSLQEEEALPKGGHFRYGDKAVEVSSSKILNNTIFMEVVWAKRPRSGILPTPAILSTSEIKAYDKDFLLDYYESKILKSNSARIPNNQQVLQSRNQQPVVAQTKKSDQQFPIKQRGSSLSSNRQDNNGVDGDDDSKINLRSLENKRSEKVVIKSSNAKYNSHYLSLQNSTIKGTEEYQKKIINGKYDNEEINEEKNMMRKQNALGQVVQKQSSQQKQQSNHHYQPQQNFITVVQSSQSQSSSTTKEMNCSSSDTEDCCAGDNIYRKFMLSQGIMEKQLLAFDPTNEPNGCSGGDKRTNEEQKKSGKPVIDLMRFIEGDDDCEFNKK